MVFDNEDARLPPPPGRLAPRNEARITLAYYRGLGDGCRGRTGCEFNFERRTEPRAVAAGPDSASMSLDDAAGDTQAQAETAPPPAGRCRPLLEGLEEVGDRIGLHTDALIAYGNLQP